MSESMQVVLKTIRDKIARKHLAQKAELMIILLEATHALAQKNIPSAIALRDETLKVLGVETPILTGPNKNIKDKDLKIDDLMNEYFKHIPQPIKPLPDYPKNANLSMPTTEAMLKFLEEVYIKDASKEDEIYYALTHQTRVPLKAEKINSKKEQNRRGKFGMRIFKKDLLEVYQKQASDIKNPREHHLNFIVEKMKPYQGQFGLEDQKVLKQVYENEKIKCSSHKSYVKKIKKREALFESLFGESPLKKERQVLLEQINKSDNLSTYLKDNSIQTYMAKNYLFSNLSQLKHSPQLKKIYLNQLARSKQESIRKNYAPKTEVEKTNLFELEEKAIQSGELVLDAKSNRDRLVILETALLLEKLTEKNTPGFPDDYITMRAYCQQNKAILNRYLVKEKLKKALKNKDLENRVKKNSTAPISI